ncbi:MAG: trans-sulfuration enzyme family protein [bacterium]
MTEKKDLTKETRILHAGEKVDLPISYPEALPIYQTSAFVLRDLDTIRTAHQIPQGGYYYSRGGNPNQDGLAAALAAAEDGPAAAVCSSGMAAILAGILAVVQAGDHIIAADAIYGGTYGLLKSDLAKLGISTSFVDLNDPAAIKNALRPETKLFVTEIATNPFVKIIDIDSVVAIAHAAGAKVLVDNTFTTPCHINPLQRGVDIVVHSATKFINGHNDVIAGAVIASPGIVIAAKHVIASFGTVISPFDAWLVLRGIKTMSLRVAKQSANALAVATALAKHPKVAQVFYPGLPDNPYHELATRLLRGGYGAMLSFYIPDDRDKVNKFMQTLAVIKFVTTLGGVRTTLSHPATTSHADLEPDLQKKMGIHNGLLRLSIGIEDAADLIADLYTALDAV